MQPKETIYATNKHTFVLVFSSRTGKQSDASVIHQVKVFNAVQRELTSPPSYPQKGVFSAASHRPLPMSATVPLQLSYSAIEPHKKAAANPGVMMLRCTMRLVALGWIVLVGSSYFFIGAPCTCFTGTLACDRGTCRRRVKQVRVYGCQTCETERYRRFFLRATTQAPRSYWPVLPVKSLKVR